MIFMCGRRYAIPKSVAVLRESCNGEAVTEV